MHLRFDVKDSLNNINIYTPYDQFVELKQTKQTRTVMFLGAVQTDCQRISGRNAIQCESQRQTL